MGHFKTLSLKIMANGILLFLILYLAGKVNWTTALLFTLVVIGVAYIVGDVLILPRAGNILAIIADVALLVGIALIWRTMGIMIDNRVIIYLAIAIAASEGLFYHPYLKRMVSIDSMGPKIGDRD